MILLDTYTKLLEVFIAVISISGNALGHWPELGFESGDSFLSVNHCGYQKLLTRSLTRSREYGRVDYQLICMVGGKGRFLFGGETTEVTDGQIVLYTPGQPQHYSYHAGDATEAYWIHFTGYAAREYLEQSGLLASSVHSVGAVDEIAAVFKKLIRELSMNKPLSGQMAAAHLLELLSLLGRKLRHPDMKRQEDPYSDIHRIMETMHEKYNEPLAIADLAKQCSLSLFRFIHKFKDVTGTNPVKYLTGIRISEAKKLLSESSLTVKEIAAIVGYENPLYFSRVFRNVVGMPPSMYKKQAK
ncbi:helix-turn-helix domain-containing protein [Paenibacillus sp. N4]|uniref:helix-turn-helix domain-containing protein n=1 Tax=Paenibacillus vietnamensis TaxID=2590547 RepID=UPI001CD08B2A|nr:helix-turn-helix domain-containing protein [Paenibacillus vietnamensis]MCA0756289.1 helix-turn-helix domain-containing protein [Paenibacillus vietnamensis]